ncbi:MAG: hypothetical protein H7175_03805 [Burkholderiales bacterium]|nr:hypothetical protein [Anaerolineae bacterium]
MSNQSPTFTDIQDQVEADDEALDITFAREPAPNPDKIPPDHLGVLLAGLVMAVGGWYGLYTIVTTSLPRVGPRWTFFVLLHIAVTGTVLPFVRYLNVRFTPVNVELSPGGVMVRQSIWIALFVVTCVWLQIPRVLSWPIVFFLALVFIVIEAFLRSRENNQDD